MSFLDIGLASLETLADPWNDLREGEENRNESTETVQKHKLAFLFIKEKNDILGNIKVNVVNEQLLV